MRPAKIICVTLAFLLGMRQPTAQADLTPQQVRDSIARGIEYLKTQQQPDGSWPDLSRYTGGVTALATLALLTAGVPVDDPQMQRALERLRRYEPRWTYVVALQTMVFCKAQLARDLLLITRNVRWLETQQVSEGPHKGSWSYNSGNHGGDNSNAQFALLALYEAEQFRVRNPQAAGPDSQWIGVDVSPQTWRRAKAYWEESQNLDGSWGYPQRQGSIGSMTCAGIASMVIAEDRVNAADASVTGDKIDCCLQNRSDSSTLDRALEWLGRHFSVAYNPGSPRLPSHYYYLYGVERVGRMTARRFIGGHDWYREGCDWLLPAQNQLSGSWEGNGYGEEDENIATSMALLFLSKGRRPILLAKLKQGVGDEWNRHRGDVANLTRYVESRWQRDLNWQLMDLKMASVDDLVQSPVLYFNGVNSPLPADAQEQADLAAKLRAYLDRSGFIFAEPNCGGKDFEDGFRQLMAKVFPEGDYRLRVLSADHPIWFAEENVENKYQRPLEGIDFGCRTSVVLAPLYPHDAPSPEPSLSCLWELARGGRNSRYSKAVQDQIKAALSIGNNVLAYATNKELQRREDGVFQQKLAGDEHDPVDRGRLHVATLHHPGGCDVAPRALLNLLESGHREFALRVSVQQEMIAINDPKLFNYHLLFMHGRNAFALTEGERKQLREFLERGGMLFADAICSNPAFTDSFRREMKAIFPETPLLPIPAKDPLFTPQYGGYDVTTVTRRDPQIRGINDPIKASLHQVTPVLEALTLSGQYAVIFSPYDLSCALEKQDSLECQGYIRDDAARIGQNVLLYSLHE